jgi:deazaflavin-dependent oxidoreductase (nitroreductase family)
VAGSPQHPDWYYNVIAHAEVEVELAGERFPANATVVTGAARDRLCALHAAANPGWGRYLSMTSREIPVIALQRRS